MILGEGYNFQYDTAIAGGMKNNVPLYTNMAARLPTDVWRVLIACQKHFNTCDIV